MNEDKVVKLRPWNTLVLMHQNAEVSLCKPIQVDDNAVLGNHLLVKFEFLSGSFIHTESLNEYLLSEIERWLISQGVITRNDIQKRIPKPSILISKPDGMYAVYILKDGVKISL